MNRQQRRTAERLAARQVAQRRMPAHQQPRRERPVHAPMVVGAELVMRPLEQIIEQIATHGTVDVDERGHPQFMAADGHWYESAGAIEGVVWHFEMLETRRQVALPLEGLRDLHIALKYLVPIRETTMAKLAHEIPVLRAALAQGDPEEQLDILQQTRIKAEFEGLAKAA